MLRRLARTCLAANCTSSPQRQRSGPELKKTRVSTVHGGLGDEEDMHSEALWTTECMETSGPMFTQTAERAWHCRYGGSQWHDLVPQTSALATHRGCWVEGPYTSALDHGRCRPHVAAQMGRPTQVTPRHEVKQPVEGSFEGLMEVVCRHCGSKLPTLVETGQMSRL